MYFITLFQQALQQLLQPKSNASTLNKGNQSATNSLQKSNQKKKEEEKKGSIKSGAVHIEESEIFNEHKLKYKLLRVAVDAIDFWLVESGAALQLWVRIHLSDIYFNVICQNVLT